MTRTSKMAIILGLASTFCYAENFNGKLIDASCYSKSRASSNSSSADRAANGKVENQCAPTASTTNFAVESGKKIYRFDAAGNSKANEAMQSGSLKADNDGDVHVSISGSRQGDTVKVDSIQGKGEHH